MSLLSDRLQSLSAEQRTVLELLLREKQQQGPGGALIPALERTPGADFPLSFAQLRLWFLDQLEPGSVAYVIPGAVRIRGTLDKTALARALSEMVRRHESLRTTFPARDGDPVQSIAAPSAVSLPVVDLSALPAEQREDEARRLALAEIEKPFDLARGPLMRVSLLQLDEQDHVLLSAMHHIVFDGWSMGVFNREIASIYKACASGVEPQLDPPPLQYADYAVWQRQWLEGENLSRQLEYWKTKLAGMPSATELPADYIRPEGGKFYGAKATARIPLDVVERLHALSREENASLFMILLAAFKCLLARYSGQEDLVIGTPIAGRNRAELEDVIGFFVNTLVLRTDLSGKPTFREVLRRVRETSLEAYANQELPFERLVEELHPERNLNRTPLFQVFFNLLNLQEARLDIQDMSVEPFGLFEPEPKFDLTLYVFERRGAPLGLTLHYNADLFASRRMEELLGQFRFALEQAAGQPDQPFAHWSLVTPEAGGVLPDPADDLAAIEFPPILHRFQEAAEQAPDKTALADLNGQWTYRELERASNRLAHTLLGQGIGQGDIVAIYGARSGSLACAMLAIWKARAAFAILDPAYPAQRLIAQIESARPVAMIELESAGVMPEELARHVELMELRSRLPLPESDDHEDLYSTYASTPPHEMPAGQDLAYVAFTSGTTGVPRAIAGTHGPLWHFIEWHIREFGLNHKDRFALLAGLSHDPLLRDVMTPLCLGTSLHIPPQKFMSSPEDLNAWIKHQRITVMHLTPALGLFLTDFQPAYYQRVKEDNALALVRYAFFGGDVLTRQTHSQFCRAAPSAQCVNFYGATETPQAMAFCRVDGEEFPPNAPARRSAVPLGKGIDAVQLLVINAEGRRAGIGEIGEICVRTPFLASGYLNDPEATAERFVPNPFGNNPADLLYHTGDLGRYLADGRVEFAGRRDYQVKIRGYRVELDEVEAVLNAHPAVDQAVVMAQNDLSGSRRLVAYLSSRRDPPPTISELRSFVQQTLPEQMSPSIFFLLDDLPLTANGKIDRCSLAAMDGRTLPQSDAHVPPRNEAERRIARTWAEMLGLEQVGVNENFFELGGHSLLATRLIARLRQEFGISIPLRALFLDSTVAGLASCIEQEPSGRWRLKGANPRWKSLVPMQPSGARRPFFLVSGAHADEDQFLRYLSNLIPHLGLDQPVYGFKPRGLDGRAEAHRSVEAMAADYLLELREFQPSGPYLIGGECIGGIVAYEMARQLKESGEHVSLLMMDTPRPSTARSILSRLRYLRRKCLRTMMKINSLRHMPLKQTLARIRAKIKHKIRLFLHTSEQDKVKYRVMQTERAYPRILFKYRPRPYEGKITLLVNRTAHSKDPTLGWEDVARQGLEVYPVPGDHVTRLTVYGQAAARQLRACLDQAQAECDKEASEVGA